MDRLEGASIIDGDQGGDGSILTTISSASGESLDRFMLDGEDPLEFRRKRNRLRVAILAGVTRESACTYASIGLDRLYSWMSMDPAFEALFLQWEAQAMVEAVGLLRQQMRRGNFQAIRFYLERSDPIRWGPKSSGMDSLDAMDPEQIRRSLDENMRLRESLEAKVASRRGTRPNLSSLFAGDTAL